MNDRSTRTTHLPELEGRGASTPRVVVLGGGYAGALAANRLVGKLGKSAHVTLVEQRDDLVHRVRLHEVIARGPGKAYPLDDVLHRSVHRIRGRAARIDASRRIVEMRGGEAVPFDELIVAVGSAPSDGIPGALAHAGALAGPEAALAAHEKIASLGPGEQVVVIGGGLSGVEVATEIAEHHPRLRVTLVAESVLPAVSDGARAYAERVLGELGIERRAAHAVAIDAGGVDLEGGERIDASVVVWAGGFVACGPKIESDLAREASGRLRVDAALRAEGREHVWVVGDAAAPPPGLPFARMSCALAMPMGAHAADNVARALRAEPAEPFRFGYAGQCISLGRKRGLVQMVTPDDRAQPRFFSGTMAAVIKELVCTFVTGALRVERMFGGAYTWPRKLEAGREAMSLPARSGRASALSPLAGS